MSRLVLPPPSTTNGATQGPALRDIHMPPAPGWWPLAPGWWLLAALLALALLIAGWAWWRWRGRHRRWLAVGREVDALAARYRATDDAAQLAGGLSDLLRRAALRCGADAHLDGAAWHAELDRLAPGALSPAVLERLRIAVYQPQARLDADAALQSCRRWLRQALRRQHA